MGNCCTRDESCNIQQSNDNGNPAYESIAMIESITKFPVQEIGHNLTTQEMLHLLHRYVWQGNFLAPVDDRLNSIGTRILDVECGEGAWVLDIARSYPDSKVVGIDSNPIIVAPDSSNQSDAEFHSFNVSHGLPFTNDTFDLVHARCISRRYAESELKTTVMQELLRILKQGGWLELMEIDYVFVNQGPNTAKLTNAYYSLLLKRGINTAISSKLEEIMRSQSGLSDIQVQKKEISIGTWGGRTGEILFEDFAGKLRKMQTPLSEHLGLDVNKFNRLIASSAKEVNKHKTYTRCIRVFGKKEAPS